MVTKSFKSLRRFSGYALVLPVFCTLAGSRVEAQTPPVTASVTTSLAAPSGVTIGGVLETNLDRNGNWMVSDWVNGGLYEYPSGGGTPITLAPLGTTAGNQSYQNNNVVFDANNNMMMNGNFSNCLLLFPYNSTTKTWTGLSTLTTGNPASGLCGTAPYSFAQYGLITPIAPQANNYFQPWGTALLPGNVLVIGDQGGKFIFTLPVIEVGVPKCTNGACSPTATPGSNNANAATPILLSMTKRPNTVAADKFGNIYFTEDSGGLAGAYMIPAGDTAIPTDTDSRIVRVDPNLGNVTGVATDANGNVYVGDSKAGVYMIPNPSGTPNTAGAILMTTVPAAGGVSVDSTRGLIYIPTTNTAFAMVSFNSALLGATAVGTPTSATTVNFNFNTGETPGSIVIEEAGAANPDFTIATGGTCKAGTAYAAGSGCSVNVTLNPHAAGAVSARLLMLDGSGNVLGAMPLSGIGSGPAIQMVPGALATIGSGLKTPSQVAVDAGGNTYIADSGFSAVQMYAKGSTTATNVGTGLTAPTGVAVDGAGDVFIADGGSGTVVAVPNGPNGLIPGAQATLKSGLGNNLKAAVDSDNNLYVSDPSNGRVVELSNAGITASIFPQTETDITTGFTSPSAVAVDSSANLYVADGTNLFQVAPGGTPTTLLNLAGVAAGLAVDPSGSVYVAQSGGTIRIPNVSGTLNPAGETIVAPSVTAPTSVTLDPTQNIYIADSIAEVVQVVRANAFENFGTLSSTTATASANFTILNDGNTALTITGFSGTADYSGASSNCSSSPIATSGTCALTVTFSPGPGNQGTLTGQVLVQSNAANSPVGVSATGVGAPLAPSTTKFTVSSPTVNGAPTVITVTPATGTTPVPTGNVTLTVTGNGITPVVLNGTLSNGTVTLTPTNLAVATYQFAVNYQGDRVYANSNSTSSVKIGAGSVTMSQPTPAQVVKNNPAYPLVLGNSSGASEPYDGSAQQFITISYYTVTVISGNGQALIGQPVYDSTGTKVIGTNYGSVTFQGASTATCAPIPVQSNGTAQFDPSCLTIDTSNNSIPNIMSAYTVTPVYSPTGTGSASSYTNPNYTAFTGTSLNYTALRNPLVAITSNPASLTVTKGSSVTATMSLASVLGYGIAGQNALLNNYSLPVQLACDGLPAYATCTFVYPNPDPSDASSVHVGPAPGTVLSVQGGTAAPCTVAQGCSGPGTVMMTITTNVPTGVAKVERPTGQVFLAMLGLGMLGLAFGRRRSLRSRIGTLAVLALCCGILAGVSGCSTTQLGGNSSPVTPAGTYTVLVTAKQVGSQVITQNPFITYGNGNQMSLPFTVQVTVQ
jgi:sugar lactone lactonase YvrE